MINISVNDTKIQYANAECQKSIGTASGMFMFLVGGESSYQKKDNVEILINDTMVLNGKIEKIFSIENKKEKHKVYFGRDNTGDFIDSYFDSVIEFNKGQLLIDLIKQTSDKFNIEVISEVDEILFSQNELPTAQVGRNIFDFYNQLCTIRNVLLTSSNNGNLLITKRGSSNANEILQMGANIISKEFCDDSTIEYDTYKVFSQNNSTLDNLNNLVNNIGQIGDGTRIKAFIENNSLTPQECTKRAQFEQELDQRKSWSYNATISSHSQENGDIWDKNLIVRLQDSSDSIDLDTIVKTICWKQSSSAEETILTLERYLS